MEKETALVETILFLEVDPIDVSKIVKISGLNKDVVLEVLDRLIMKYARNDSGIELMEIEASFSLAPRQEFAGQLHQYYGKKLDEKISKAALETLSIIAYAQPLTRIEIENIRGVSCTGALKVLQERELIQEIGRKEAPGRPVQYGTTKQFLRTFGLASIAELPKLDGAERDRFELKET